MNQSRQIVIFIVMTALLATSCGISKQSLQLLDSKEKAMIELPIDYCNLFPTPTFEQWDKDYNTYSKFLTQDIIRTQAGLSFTNKGVQIWWCVPSASPHVQLDTATRINDNKLVFGVWRIACNRKITYEDSAAYADKKIYRNSKVDYDNKEDDLFLSMTADKFRLYVKKKGESNFKTVANKHYHIENKRYLMLYGLSKSASAISFVGLDKEGRLIINAFYVQERKIKDSYIVYQATMTQFIFTRMI